MDSLDTTLFRLPEFKLPFFPTSSGRLFAGFTVAIKTPGIYVNFAPINEIKLFGIISGIIAELISRITWSLPLVIPCILRKFTASFMLNSRKETQSLANFESKILGLSTHVIEQGLKQ